MSLAWGGHSNGRIPLTELEPIGRSVYGLGEQYAHPAAARAWRAMLKDAGLSGFALTVGEGYRSYARQEVLRRQYLAGNGPVAAVPGTSNHGWGRAIDIAGYTRAELDWLGDNAAKFGWSWKTGEASGEPWHWEYVGPLEFESSAAEAKGNSMTTLYYTKQADGTNLFALAGDGNGQAAWLETTGSGLATEWARAHNNAIELSAGTFALWKKHFTEGAGSAVSVNVDEAAIGAAVAAALKPHLDRLTNAVTAQPTSFDVVPKPVK